ncbi:MAG: hypothetical protein ACFFDR_02315, partial [Candidatus Thorarchaeota archaeon]
VNYTRNRVAQLPDEERGAGRPLYVSLIGIFFLGIASLLLHVNLTITDAIEVLAAYYTTAMFGAFLLCIAALMILGRTKLNVIPGVLFIIGLAATIGVLYFGLPEFLLYAIPGIMIEVLYFIPAGLFLYLTYTTRRVTSLSFAVVLIIYPLYPLFLVFEANYLLTLLLIAIRMYAPALLLIAFAMPEIGISGEFWGYGASFATMALWVSYLVSTGAPVVSLTLVALTLIAVGTAIGLGTAAYTYGRFTKSRNRATLLLSVFFVFAAFGFLLPTIDEIANIGNFTFVYIYLSIGMLTMMLLNIGSFLALDWKSWALAPVIIGLPAFVYTWLFYPQNPDFTPGRGMVMGLTLFTQTIIPLILYLRLGYRIRKAGGKGYLRPTFLGLGIIFLILGSYSGETSRIESAIPLFLAFCIWWLGVTGRADRYLGTA